jgi:hypothetical protein
MGHDEAVQTLATEKYLLGELSSEVREQFEDHFFRLSAVRLRSLGGSNIPRAR